MQLLHRSSLRGLARAHALAVLSAAGLAQVPAMTVPGEPVPLRAPRPRPSFAADPVQSAGEWSRVDVAQMPTLDLTPYVLEDEQADSNGPVRVGIDRDLPQAADTDNSGRWSQEGDRNVWRFRVRDAGAQALRLCFDRFELPTSGRLVVGNADQSATWQFGPEAVQVDGTFWTPPVPGDEIWIEYSAAERPETSPLRIRKATHLYKGGYGGAYQGFDCTPDDACHLDVACASGIDSSARDCVGRMLFSTGGSTAHCSGALLNDVDPTTTVPYFLTANHCISTQAEASSLNVVFLYHLSGCGAPTPDPSTLPQVNGSTLLTTSTTTDVTLLQLSGLPGGVTLGGWTTALPADGDSVVGIHHPNGCRKAVSDGVIDQTPVSKCVPTSDHWFTTWTNGHTEGGSSGSPLFDENWRIIGQLRAGCGSSSACGGSGTQWNDAYGRLDASFALLSPFIAQSAVWVQFFYFGPPLGTPANPFPLLGLGISAVPTGGLIRIRPGTTPEAPRISKHLRMEPFGGVVRIGG